MRETLNRENLAAIGLVVTEWARLEDQICLNTASLIVGEPIIPAWLLTMGSSPSFLLPRARAYMNLALSADDRAEYLPQFDALNERISRAQVLRNRVTHSAWRQEGVERLATAPLRLRGKRFDFEQIEMTREELLGLAEEIVKLRVKVSELLIDAERARDANVERQ